MGTPQSFLLVEEGCDTKPEMQVTQTSVLVTELLGAWGGEWGAGDGERGCGEGGRLSPSLEISKEFLRLHMQTKATKPPLGLRSHVKNQRPRLARRAGTQLCSPPSSCYSKALPVLRVQFYLQDSCCLFLNADTPANTPLTCVISIIWERRGQAEQVHPGRALQRPGVEGAQLSCGCWAQSIHQAPRSRGRRSSGSEPVVILRGWLCHLGFWDGPAGQPAPPLPPPRGPSFPLWFCPCLSPVQVGRQRARVLAPGPVSESAILASLGGEGGR